jgi:hypothetical protein
MATRTGNGALGCGGRRELGCGSEAAERLVAKAGGSRPFKKQLKKPTAPQKKCQKKRPVAGHSSNCLKKRQLKKKRPFKVVIKKSS